MGEFPTDEIPLDPNQVEPPKESQLDQQPGDQPGHIDVFHDDGQQTGEPQIIEPTKEEPIPASYIRNEDKARVMAETENDELDGFPEYGNPSRVNQVTRASIDEAVQDAADEYELEVQAEREGIEPEELEDLINSDQQAFLNYAHAVAENHAKYGDILSPNLRVLESVNQLAQRYPDLIRSKGIRNYYTNIEIEFSDDAGFLTIKVDDNYRSSPKDAHKPKTEIWSASVFGADVNNEYAVTEYSEDPDFRSVATTKTRSLKAKDAAKLQKRVTSVVGRGSFDPKPRFEDDEEDVSTTEVARRAQARFGDTEQARESAKGTPGDFI